VPAAPAKHGHEPSPSLPSLANLLSSDSIAIWDEPVLKEEVLNVLTKGALGDEYRSLLPEASRKVREREQLGSTFFNEGIAFPHARLDDLSEPRIALGLARYGIADVITEQPIEVVFLILSPAQSLTAQLQLLALTSKAGQNRHFLQSLRTATSPAGLIEGIKTWEDGLKNAFQ